MTIAHEPRRIAPEHYDNGLTRPATMADLPEWALREFLIRHSGPALDAAKDEADYRGWPTEYVESLLA